MIGQPDGAKYDEDGLYIPINWRSSGKWATFHIDQRRALSEGREALECRMHQDKPTRPYYKRFSTSYAVQWGRAQGWKLVDRENYDHKTRRSRDLMLGVDCLFDDGQGLIGVQAAGRYQRAEHYTRFADRGGIETAGRRHIRIAYIEFVKGCKKPFLIEWWVP